MQNLHLGTMGWSYNFWKGSFYPEATPSKAFLAYYGTQFNTVEVDSTFYRMPTEKTVANWKEQTPSNFVFSLKFPGVITHIKMLRNCQNETNLFLERTKSLKQKLGPLLLQFPPNFGIDHMPDLDHFLSGLPKENRYVVEVRNEAWFIEEFYSLLRTNNVALAWIDSPHLTHASELTQNLLYIRWEGDRKKVRGTLGKIEADVQEGLRFWADKIKSHLNPQMEIFGYFGKYYSGFPPSDIKLLSEFLR